MTRAHIVLLALTFGLVAVWAPALAAALPCAGGEGCAEDCGLDCESCFLCLCCAHPPQPILDAAGAGFAAGRAGRVGLGEDHRPQAPRPRDILHVPKPDLSR